MTRPTVGILALQGDVPEHRAILARIRPAPRVLSVRGAADLDRVDALLLPGGESTTIARLLRLGDLWEPLRHRIQAGLPTLATCAGLIVLARSLETPPGGGRNPETLGVLDATVRRNDYGRQRESFEASVRVRGVPGRPFPGVFIRAPRILEVGPNSTPIARRGAEVVGVKTGSVWGLTFHPELSGDPRVHARFLAETLGSAAIRRARPRAQRTKTSRRTKSAAAKARPRATATQ
jgi:5'-phosphate synthase pdxT subunit